MTHGRLTHGPKYIIVVVYFAGTSAGKNLLIHEKWFSQNIILNFEYLNIQKLDMCINSLAPPSD